jgi:hypothetical protein
MNYRLATVWPRKNYSSDTEIIETMKVTDPISQLIITYEPDNNPSGSHATAHPAKCVTKIELVDGSDVLYSLSGMEAQGVDFYHNKMTRPQKVIFLNGMTSEMIYVLNFGRYLWDKELALVPKNHDNLQWKVTLDIDGGGDESNDGYLTVFAHCFDEQVVSPRGFITTKEVKGYTLADSTTEITSLPTDHPYKQLYVRAQRYGTGPEYQIDTIKLHENNSKRVPVECTMFQALRNLACYYPDYLEWILVHSSTTVQYFYNTPCYWPSFSYVPWRADSVALAGVCYGGDGGRFQYDAGSSGPNASVFVLGQAPHAVVPLLPDFGMSTDDWYDVTKVDELDLELKGTSSVGTSQTAEIITEQLRAY